MADVTPAVICVLGVPPGTLMPFPSLQRHSITCLVPQKLSIFGCPQEQTQRWGTGSKVKDHII